MQYLKIKKNGLITIINIIFEINPINYWLKFSLVQCLNRYDANMTECAGDLYCVAFAIKDAMSCFGKCRE